MIPHFANFKPSDESSVASTSQARVSSSEAVDDAILISVFSLKMNDYQLEKKLIDDYKLNADDIQKIKSLRKCLFTVENSIFTINKFSATFHHLTIVDLKKVISEFNQILEDSNSRFPIPELQAQMEQLVQKAGIRIREKKVIDFLEKLKTDETSTIKTFLARYTPSIPEYFFF